MGEIAVIVGNFMKQFTGFITPKLLTFSGSGSSSTEVVLLKEALDEFLLIDETPESGLGLLSWLGGDH